MAAIIALPLDQSVPWYSFSITLDQASYTLEFYYNTRSARWRMNILDAGDNAVLMGLPLLIRRDITGPYHYLNIPPGAFMALDDRGDRTEPTLGSFLLDHTLYYLEA